MAIYALRPELARQSRGYDGTSGTYVYVDPRLQDLDKIAGWSRDLGISIPPERVADLHCTVMWSSDTPNQTRTDPTAVHRARVDHFEHWYGHDGDGYVVAVLDSPFLHRLHQKWVARGCQHTFPDYVPHMTLASKIKATPELLARLDAATEIHKRMPISFINESIENAKS